MEFNFDKINLKDAHQSHVDLIKTMQVHASPALTAIPGVPEAFDRLERTLSKLLIPYMNAIATRRGYSAEHQAMINPLSIDPEVADGDSDSDSDQYYIDPTLELDSPTDEHAVSHVNMDTMEFLPRQPFAAACDSIISERLAETDFQLGSNRNTANYQGKGKGIAKARCDATATAKPSVSSSLSLILNLQSSNYCIIQTVFSTAVYDASGAVLGTFTPLRPSHHGLSNSPVVQSSKLYRTGVPMNQLVQLAGTTANQDASFSDMRSLQEHALGECEDDYEILSPARPSLRSHSDSDSSKRRISKFRPSRQTGQDRTPGRG